MFKKLYIILLSALMGIITSSMPLQAMDPSLFEVTEEHIEAIGNSSNEGTDVNELGTGSSTPTKVGALVGGLLLTIYLLDTLDVTQVPMQSLVALKEFAINKLKELFGPEPRTRSRDLLRIKLQNRGLITRPTPTWRELVLNKLREFGLISPTTEPRWREIMTRATQNHFPILHERLARVIRLARMISLLSQFSDHI